MKFKFDISVKEKYHKNASVFVWSHHLSMIYIGLSSLLETYSRRQIFHGEMQSFTSLLHQNEPIIHPLKLLSVKLSLDTHDIGMGMGI